MNDILTVQAEPGVDLTSFKMRLVALWRGVRGRCPNCGHGKLLRNYLKVAGPCEKCGEDYAQIPADDMPPWLTIVIVGHLLVPEMWYVQRHVVMPMWAELTLWLSLGVILLLAILPRSKGFCIALLWMLPRLPSRKRAAAMSDTSG